MEMTLDEIKEWIIGGKERKASHMIILYDKFDDMNYVVYVNREEDPESILLSYERDRLYKVQEMINLSHYNNKGEYDV